MKILYLSLDVTLCVKVFFQRNFEYLASISGKKGTSQENLQKIEFQKKYTETVIDQLNMMQHRNIAVCLRGEQL